MTGRSLASATRREVGDEPGLRRLVVVRRHGEHAVGAGLLGGARRLDALGGVVAAGAGDDDAAGRRPPRRRRGAARPSRRRRSWATRPSCPRRRGRRGPSRRGGSRPAGRRRGRSSRRRRMGVTIAERTRPRAGAVSHGAKVSARALAHGAAPTRARRSGSGRTEARHYSLGGPSRPRTLIAGVRALQPTDFLRPRMPVSAPLVGDPGEAGRRARSAQWRVDLGKVTEPSGDWSTSVTSRRAAYGMAWR